MPNGEPGDIENILCTKKDLRVTFLGGAESVFQNPTDFSAHTGLSEPDGRLLFHHARRRYPEAVKKDELALWGFPGAATERATDTDWNFEENDFGISRVVLGTGRSPWEGNVFYGSNVCDGDASTFWPIRFCSIQSFRARPDSPTQITNFDAVSNNVDGSSIISSSRCEREEFLEYLYEWCMKYPGRVYDMDASGARGPSSLSKGLFITSTRIFCRSSDGFCVRASIANAIQLSASTEAARNMLQLGFVPTRNLTDASKWIQSKASRYCLRRVAVPANMETHMWLLTQPSGVFIVSVQGMDSVGDVNRHTVVIDADRGVMHDSVEPFALRLCEAAFDCAVGDGFEFFGVEEVRRFHVNPLGKRKRKCHRQTRKAKKRFYRLCNAQTAPF